MTNNLECTVGLAIPSDTSPLFSVAIEQYLDGWLTGKSLTLQRIEADGMVIFYSSSRPCGTKTIDMVMAHTRKYAEVDDQLPRLIELRRSTEYIVAKE